MCLALGLVAPRKARCIDESRTSRDNSKQDADHMPVWSSSATAVCNSTSVGSRAERRPPGTFQAPSRAFHVFDSLARSTKAKSNMASVALEVISLVELSVKYGEVIKIFIEDVRHSEAEQNELLLDVSSRLKVIDLHEEMFQKLPKSHIEALKDRMTRMKKSAEELVAVTQKLKTDPYVAVKWALGKKKKVQKTVDTILEDQRNLELEMMFLGINSMLPVVDGDVKKIVLFIDKSLADRQNANSRPELELARLPVVGSWTPLDYSNFETAISQNGNHFVAEEHVWESSLDREKALARIREVATTFHANGTDDLNFQSLVANIAQCVGYVKDIKSAKLVFELPSNVVKIQSLRQMLREENTHSLNARLELARSLSRAVLFTHAYQYVHKNIRSSNILVGESHRKDSTESCGQVLLAGFGDSRAESAFSKGLGDSRNEYDIYRHPSRTGSELLPKYTFLHDVYSLGVCLLEIGLWTDLLDEDWKALHNASARERSEMLKTYAEEYLPVEMGTAYRDVVLDCLGGVDGSFVHDVAQPSDGRQVGMGYIEIVLDGLGVISI